MKEGVAVSSKGAAACFLVPVAATAVSIAALCFLGMVGWPGEVGAAGRDFCEASRPGPIRQPANTYSNAAFFLAGVGIGLQAWRDVAARKRATWRNKLVTTVFYPATLAICSVLIGIGSTALHASMTRWSVELDHFGMHVWGTWCIAFTATRLFRKGDRAFLGLWLAQLGALLTRMVSGRPYLIDGSRLFGAMIVVAVTLELASRWRNRHRQRLDNQYLVAAVVTFLVAYACSLVSTNAGPWCEPQSLWQGHAAWHILCAGSTVFVYLYGRSERQLP
ncbi:MAG: ceramidase domain-containing protein [Planctomycetota bacterium]